MAKLCTERPSDRLQLYRDLTQQGSSLLLRIAFRCLCLIQPFQTPKTLR